MSQAGPADFVLLEGVKPGEPSWPSALGEVVRGGISSVR